MKLVALIAGLFVGSVAWAGQARVTGVAPTQNTDGTALTDLMSYRIQWGCTVSGSAQFQALIPGDAPTFAYDVLGLPDTGSCSFTASALNTANVESGPSNQVTKVMGGALALPGKAGLAVVTQPDSAVTVTMRLDIPTSPDQPTLVVAGNAVVRLALLGVQVFDWCKVGANTDGVGGTVTPTTPPLGTLNNDRDSAGNPIVSRVIDVQGPVTTVCDVDESVGSTAPFGGANVTVGGVTKPLQRAGSTWSASFLP